MLNSKAKGKKMRQHEGCSCILLLKNSSLCSLIFMQHYIQFSLLKFILSIKAVREAENIINLDSQMTARSRRLPYRLPILMFSFLSRAPPLSVVLKRASTMTILPHTWTHMAQGTRLLLLTDSRAVFQNSYDRSNLFFFPIWFLSFCHFTPSL